MTRGPDASRRLTAAIERSGDAAGLSMRIAEATSSPWASATFAGARHRVTLSAETTPRLAAWLKTLPEADLPMKDHLVADLTVVTVDRGETRTSVTLEALTVEER